MLAPLFVSVTLSVSQICLPVAASRQASRPYNRSEKMCRSLIRGSEVWLKIRADMARDCGHRNDAAGLRAADLKHQTPKQQKFAADDGSRNDDVPRRGHRLAPPRPAGRGIQSRYGLGRPNDQLPFSARDDDHRRTVGPRILE